MASLDIAAGFEGLQASGASGFSRGCQDALLQLNKAFRSLGMPTGTNPNVSSWAGRCRKCSPCRAKKGGACENPTRGALTTLAQLLEWEEMAVGVGAAKGGSFFAKFAKRVFADAAPSPPPLPA
jgi:hypothetical protein